MRCIVQYTEIKLRDLYRMLYDIKLQYHKTHTVIDVCLATNVTTIKMTEVNIADINSTLTQYYKCSLTLQAE